MPTANHDQQPATRIIRKAYKYRLYPTEEQAQRLAQWCGCVRAFYNAALEQRELYGRAKDNPDPHGREIRLHGRAQGYEIKNVRREIDWMKDVPAIALYAALDDLNYAFNNFFSDTARYPRPRKKFINDSFRLPVFISGSARSKGFDILVVFGRDRLKLPKLGYVKFCKHQKFRGAPKNVTITRKAGRWYISLLVEIEITECSPVNDLAIGDSLHVRDLSIPEGVKLLNDPDLPVVSVVAPTVVEEPEAAEEGEEAEVAAEGADAEAAEDSEKQDEPKKDSGD